MSILRNVRNVRTVPLRHTPGHLPTVRAARVHLLGLFALMGITLSSTLARIPTMKSLLGITEAQLGLLFLFGSIGGLTAIMISGPMVQRYGGRITMLISTGAMAISLVLGGIGPTIGSIPLFSAFLFFQGASFGLGNVPQNLEAAAVERRLGRTVIPQFHAAYSLGAVAGAGLGALASAWGISVSFQLIAAAGLFVAWRLVSIPHIILDSLPQPRILPSAASRTSRTPGSSALKAWREPMIIVLGLMIISAPFSEGGANDWLPLAIVQGFEQTEAVGAITFAVFLSSMTVVRIFGTRLIDTYGGTTMLRASAVSSIIGIAVLVTAPTFIIGLLGVVAWGAGAALVVPIGIAAASRDPLRAAGRVSVVSAFSSMASLVAPPVIGVAAHSVGARQGLTVIIVALLVTLLLSPVVRKVEAAARAVAAPSAPEVAAPLEHTPALDADEVFLAHGLPVSLEDTEARLADASR